MLQDKPTHAKEKRKHCTVTLIDAKGDWIYYTENTIGTEKNLQVYKGTSSAGENE